MARTLVTDTDRAAAARILSRLGNIEDGLRSQPAAGLSHGPALRLYQLKTELEGNDGDPLRAGVPSAQADPLIHDEANATGTLKTNAAAVTVYNYSTASYAAEAVVVACQILGRLVVIGGGGSGGGDTCLTQTVGDTQEARRYTVEGLLYEDTMIRATNAGPFESSTFTVSGDVSGVTYSGDYKWVLDPAGQSQNGSDYGTITLTNVSGDANFVMTLVTIEPWDVGRATNDLGGWQQKWNVEPGRVLPDGTEVPDVDLLGTPKPGV